MILPGDGSRFRGRFGFEFELHVINYLSCGGPLKSDENSLGNVTYRFRTTRWTVVLLSAQSQAPGYQAALGELYRIYWYPLYAYIRRPGQTPEEAQNLTQGRQYAVRRKEADELRALCDALTASEGHLEL